MKDLFDMISKKSSKLTTVTYSTSFSMGIRFFSRRFHDPIYAIYGFVRFGDEIVDSFHGFDKAKLLERFKNDTRLAIEEKISLNPILNNFQWAVNKYNIEWELIEKFLNSMEMDLRDIHYDQPAFEEYILGSAEVVGLMCLRVFCEGDEEKYQKLKGPAMRLGSAFQKINFLRDLKADYQGLGRSYFPNIDLSRFDDEAKRKLEDDISIDFADGLDGIRKLPRGARFGVYMAYVYFYNLFLKIKRTKSSQIMNERVRIPNSTKYKLLVTSYIRHQLNMF
ncbi:MAG: phytoene/squalene synthase family protein [Lentimicrobiaceae bacterium]|nr:phytoene/squalene synthase family protein [Lentimicrobiaceae bacterium]MCB9022965.1 phytoene/squalene synthase family protein [Lentimicrobiaceae bacterium]